MPRPGASSSAALACLNPLASNIPEGFGDPALFAPKVISACCILHNLCLLTGDILEEDEEEEDEEHQGNVPDQGDQELSGIHLRARLAAQVSAPGELPAFLREH
ncbi:hypothetical protein FQN60_006009, partial [Etheostoma spectabile]